MEKLNRCNYKNIILYSIFFKLQLLKYIGYQPMIDFCNICNQKLINSTYDWSIGQLVCTNCNNKKSNLYIKYLLSVILISIISLLLIMQPDIGQTLLVVFSWAVLIFTSGINIFFLFGFSLFVLSLLAYLIIYVPKFDYIQGRIFSFFNRDIGAHNFQSDKAIESITSGGFFGKGIGEGILKNRVPEAHTDYIISVISEEFGVVAIILILILFLTLIYMVFKRINYEKNEKIKLVLIGCVSLILMQATIHVGVNIRLFPTTGMTLPFLSYGGSSIVSVSILSGIILNLTKRKINHQR